MDSCLNENKLPDVYEDIINSNIPKHIHFIGIGGISMSGLAEILMKNGHHISGSDMKPSSTTEKLEKMGMTIYIGHSEDNIKNPDLVVYTAAIKNDNPEFIKAQRLGIPIIDRATLLGLIMKKYPYSVAVSGTHGKTTTTSMISMVTLECGLNPTVHIGGELEYIGGATRSGGSAYFIAEACEYCESFLKLYPFIAVILNIEYDHADYYKDIEHIRSSFLKFASLVPENGYVVVCADDENIAMILDKIPAHKVTYGINQGKKNRSSGKYTWSAENITIDPISSCASFTLLNEGREIDTVRLAVPGIHNVYNSLATIAVCHLLGCNLRGIKTALEKFTGTHRRFEFKGFFKNNIRVYDDYAHHPTEIKATLKAAKTMSSSRDSRIWCVFQPHTYTRTKALLDEFASSFFDADRVIIADIYAAREPNIYGIDSGMLAEKINETSGNAMYISGFEAIANYLQDNVLPGDMVLTVGAGDIYKVGEILLKRNND